ncbi:kinase-like domain-containing protein, partial [Epithele typhae]|uniref:kinase-like domain-containing protein n=1 Tax=Epithele typhae TaxID=378194 RepID=UPI0020075EF5
MPCRCTIPEFASYTVDRYKFERRLSSSPHAAVYLAHESEPDTTTTTPRAIKIMRVHPRTGNSTPGQEHERKTLAYLAAHAVPNVTRLVRAIRCDIYILFVFEYMSGGSLKDALDARAPLLGDIETVKRLFLQILDGVTACHLMGIYHRNLSLDNIIVDSTLSRACIGGFRYSTKDTVTSQFGVGAKRFMCPECIENNDVDQPDYNTRRNDVWALGVILVNLAFDIDPFEEASARDPCYRAFRASPIYFRTELPISLGLQAILNRVFTVDPDAAMSLTHLRAQICDLKSFWMAPFDL